MSKLVELRTAKGWSKADMARELGVSQQYVGKVEAGEKKMSRNLAMKARDALGCEPDALKEHVSFDLAAAIEERDSERSRLERERDEAVKEAVPPVAVEFPDLLDPYAKSFDDYDKYIEDEEDEEPSAPVVVNTHSGGTPPPPEPEESEEPEGQARPKESSARAASVEDYDDEEDVEPATQGKRVDSGMFHKPVDKVAATAMAFPGGDPAVCREVIDSDGYHWRDGITIGEGEQAVVLLGIDFAACHDIKGVIRPDPGLMIKHELWVHPSPVVVGGELAAVVYCHGRPVSIDRGMVIGTIE